MRLLCIVIALFLSSSSFSKQKTRITEEGSSIFYRSWRFPMVTNPSAEDTLKKESPAETIDAGIDTTTSETTPGIADTLFIAEKQDTSKTGTFSHNTDSIIHDETDICILYFIFDQDNMVQEYLAEIDTILLFIRHHADCRFDIVGHTDERGSVAYNQTLSERRAKKVESILIKRGVASERLSTKGKSKLSPAIPHAKTKREHQLNRRVEIIARKRNTVDER